MEIEQWLAKKRVIHEPDCPFVNDSSAVCHSACLRSEFSQKIPGQYGGHGLECHKDKFRVAL